MSEQDVVAAGLALLVALILAAAVAFGRGRNRCAVWPRKGGGDRLADAARRAGDEGDS